MVPKRLSILGVGLLGGSLGMAAKAVLKGCEVVGYGHRPETLNEATSRGAIDRGTDSAAEAAKGADLVVLCTPVGLFEPLLREIAPVLAPGAVVTDVGSTKRSVVAAAERNLPPHASFVGSHPMAGSEKRGVQFATADLFQNAVCIVTPTPATPSDPLKQTEQFWRLLGMEVRRMPPEEHDRRLADVSHLPHALAAALVVMQDDDSLPVAGKGFADVTRIAAGDPGLWRDIFLDNHDNLKDAALRFRRRLDQLLVALDARDGEATRAWLQTAAARRQSLPDRTSE